MDFTSEISEEYQSASIFAMTSLYEGLPNALMEALAFGLPSIAFNCNYGPSDLIKDGINGFLIDEHEIDEFVEKLNLLTGDADLRKRLQSYSDEFRLYYNGVTISDRFLKYVLCD
jgi:glycosyltransferase involved in cell wall biosynthesis